MFYINWSIQANLSQCALRKYDCFRLELSSGGAPVEFMHVPQFCACTLSCLCCEHRRPQWAATVRCLEWADVYSPPYGVLKDMGWHVAALQAAYALTFPQRGDTMTAKRLGNGLWTAGLYLNTVAGTDTKKRSRIFPWSYHSMSTVYYKENIEHFYVATFELSKNIEIQDLL